MATESIQIASPASLSVVARKSVRKETVHKTAVRDSTPGPRTMTYNRRGKRVEIGRAHV